MYAETTAAILRETILATIMRKGNSIKGRLLDFSVVVKRL